MVKFSRVLPGLVPTLLLLLFFGIALWIRIALPYGQVFTSNGIVFTGNDAYYHMRLVQGFVNNFPHFPGVDPYLLFSNIYNVIPSFFQWLLGAVVWVIGLGSPSQHMIDAVGAYYPAVLGALTVVPAYFIGKELWGKHGRWAGVVAAALVALLPGEFLGRSILGFTDQHVMETLLSTTSILFLILAVKSARLRQLAFTDFKNLNWRKILLPSLYALLCGFFLGLYIFAWQGALLLVFTIAVYLIVQFVIDHLKNRSTDYLSIVGILIFMISLIFLPVVPTSLYPPSLIIGLLIPLVLGVLSHIMVSRRINRVVYPLIVVVGGLAGLGLFYLINPSLIRSMLGAFNIFAPSGTLLATIEAQSIFTPTSSGGGFLSSPAWINFYFALPFAFIAIVIMFFQSVTRQGNAERVAFIIWTLVMLIATIGQRRFAYYFAVNIALLAGYTSILVYYLITWILAYTGGDRSRSLSWRVLELDGLAERMPVAESEVSPTTKKARRRQRQIARKYEMERRRTKREQARNVRLIRDSVSISLSAIVIFMLLLSPLVLFPDPAHGITKAPSIATAGSTPYAPTDGWVKSLNWMKDNTPEPLGSADDYYKHYSTDFTYPASAWGVMAWWDYGYWITYIAHRIPIANPGQDQVAVKKVASFFTALDEESAEIIASDTKTSYIIVDYQAASSKFWAIATWAGKSQSDFFEVYWDAKNNQQKLYIYPAYYQAMSTRLYSFNGTAQAGINPLVVNYVVRTTDGGSYKEIVSEQQFTTYEEAIAFMSGQTSGDYAIAGTDVLVSPIPLEALQHYRPVYSSESMVSISSTNQTPEIKIFERIN